MWLPGRSLTVRCQSFGKCYQITTDTTKGAKAKKRQRLLRWRKNFIKRLSKYYRHKKSGCFHPLPDPGQKPGFFIAHPGSKPKRYYHTTALHAEIPFSKLPAHAQACTYPAAFSVQIQSTSTQLYAHLHPLAFLLPF